MKPAFLPKDGVYKGVAALFSFGGRQGIIVAPDKRALVQIARAYCITDVDISKTARVNLTERK